MLVPGKAAVEGKIQSGIGGTPTCIQLAVAPRVKMALLHDVFVFVYDDVVAAEVVGEIFHDYFFH